MIIGDRRLGRFFVASHALLLPAMRMVMSACIVVDCKFDATMEQFEYVAVSPHFRRLPFGMVVPTYNWILYMDPIIGEGIRGAEEYREEPFDGDWGSLHIIEEKRDGR